MANGMTDYVHGVPEKYIRSFMEIPDRWFWWGTLWNGDFDEGRRAQVYTVAILRLPVWGSFYDVARDEYRWGQRVLLYHGKSGFRLGTRFT